MYEKLVERLRKRADELNEKFSRNAELLSELTQTANAIEDLQEDNAELNGTVSNLIGQIAELSKPRWVSVTERLPEQFKPVLCFGHNGIMVDYYSGDKSELYNTPLFMICEGKVTHWMPLPPIPNNELGNDNVIWCEDCKFFGHADMGGEGWCDTYDAATWYGKNAVDCPYFKPKGE